MAGLPNTFDVIRSDPDWKALPPEEQVEVREKWVQKRMLASGDPRNQKLYEQLIREAYSDLPQQKGEGGGFWPARPEFKERMATAWERGWGVPKEALWGTIKEVGTGEGTIPQRLSRMPAQIRDYFIGKREATKLPEEMEAVPGSSLWSDPLMWSLGKLVYGVGKRVVGEGVKSVSKIGERIRPPVAEGLPWGEIPGKVPPLRTVGPPEALAPLAKGTYNRAMAKLTPHLPRDQAQLASKYIARNPADELVVQIMKGNYTPEIEAELLKRITPTVPFKKMPTFEEASKRVEAIRGKGKRVTPPKAGVQPPAEPGDITNPRWVADAIDAISKEQY